MTTTNQTTGTVGKRSLARRIALYAGAALGGLVALVFLINLYDPGLDPRAAALLEATPPPVAEKDNAYFVLYGLGVAAGQDAHAHGVRFVTSNNGWMMALDRGEPADRTEVDKLAQENKVLPWRGGATRELCPAPRADCLAAYARNRAKVMAFADENRVRLERYRSLYRYEQFREVSLNRVTLNWLPNLAGAEHETVLGQIALKALDGKVDEALRELSADTAYWRRVLAGASTGVSKSVATDFLARNCALASEIAARYRDRAGIGRDLAEMTRPLSSEEKDWRHVLESDFQWEAQLYRSLRGQQIPSGVLSNDMQVWERLALATMYRANATVNLRYQLLEKSQALVAEPAPALLAAAERASADFEMYTDPWRADMIYNPVGKILVAVGTASPDTYAKYVARTHNLEGSMRLLATQLDIYAKRLKAQQIGQYLEQSATYQRDPYQDKPFQWDQRAGTLWFEGIDPSSESNGSSGHRISAKI